MILSVRLERKIDCHQSVNTACCESDRMVRNLPNDDKFSIVSRVCTTIRAMHLSVHVSRLVKTVCHVLTTHYHKRRFHTYRLDTVNSNTVSPITRIFGFLIKIFPMEAMFKIYSKMVKMKERLFKAFLVLFNQSISKSKA